MRAVCSGTGRRGCCGWSDMVKPPAITAPTPLSTLRLTHSPTVSDPKWDSERVAVVLPGSSHCRSTASGRDRPLPQTWCRATSPRSSPPHPHGHPVGSGEIPLTEPLARSVPAPAIIYDQKLALDLDGHAGLPSL